MSVAGSLFLRRAFSRIPGTGAVSPRGPSGIDGPFLVRCSGLRWVGDWRLLPVGMIRLAGLAGSGGGARWRVFISHTSELREFPKEASYVAAVERAVAAAGHVIVDMRNFPAADQAPADLCAERLRGCDVYIGVLGTRYGSPVRDKQEVSYTELEFDTATKADLDRLVFLLDTDADDVGIPPSRLIDREFGGRQDAFRRRVQDSRLVTQSFAGPDALQLLVERSLRDLADTRARIGSGIAREQVPAEPQPVRASKFVNPPPAWRRPGSRTGR